MSVYKESRFNLRVKLRRGRILLYNTLSRALCLLEEQEAALLGDIPNLQDVNVLLNNRVIQYLLGQGFVLPAESNELQTVKNLYDGARYDPTVVNLIVCPTLACNFGCDYCFQGEDKPLEVMSPEVQDRVAGLYQRLLDTQPGIRKLQMIWYGGEPLMRKKVLYDMADRLIDISIRNDKEYDATMVTNGFMLNKEVAIELFNRGLHSVQITLDGSEEFHDARRHLLSSSKKGTYWKILKNLKEWIDEVPIAVSIRVNIDERNKDGIMNLIDDLAERGLAGKSNLKMYFSPVETNTQGCHSVSELTMKKMDYGELEARLNRYAFRKGLISMPYPPRFLGICSALRPNDYIIVPSGDVHKCWDTVSFPDKRVGTLYDMDKLLGRQNFNHQLWENFDPFKNEICKSCKLLPSCSSYCAHKFVYVGDSAGDSILPCPSLKFSINERLILKAEMEGYISRDDYDPDEIKTDPYELTPVMHTVDSMISGSRMYVPTEFTV